MLSTPARPATQRDPALRASNVARPRPHWERPSSVWQISELGHAIGAGTPTDVRWQISRRGGAINIHFGLPVFSSLVILSLIDRPTSLVITSQPAPASQEALSSGEGRQSDRQTPVEMQNDARLALLFLQRAGTQTHAPYAKKLRSGVGGTAAGRGGFPSPVLQDRGWVAEDKC